jgi:hypothetical protein
MAHTPRRRGLSAGIARIAKLGRRRSEGNPEASPEELDRRLPEQRILDTAARYPALGVDPPGRHHGGSTTARTGHDAAASADPAAAEEPAWVRRLGDQMVVMPTLPGAQRPGGISDRVGRPASSGRRRSPDG